MSLCKREVQVQQDEPMEEPDPGLPEYGSHSQDDNRPVIQTQWFASTPALTEQTREYDQMSPEISVIANGLCSTSWPIGVCEVVHSYMETLAQGTVGRYRILPVTLPKFKKGGN